MSDVVVLINQQVHAPIVCLNQLIYLAEVVPLHLLDLLAIIDWQSAHLSSALVHQDYVIRLQADLGVDFTFDNESRSKPHDLSPLKTKLSSQGLNVEALMAVLVS